MANILAASFREIESRLFFKGLNANMHPLNLLREKSVRIDFKADPKERRDCADSVVLVTVRTDGPY